MLREERGDQCRTLADVAEASWVSLQYLSEVERGRKDISSELLAAVCRGLEVSLPDVLERAADKLRAHGSGLDAQMLAGGLTCGFAVAIFMANAGGAWDNAKKLLESYGKITASDVVNGTGNASKVPAEIRDEITAKAQEFVNAGQGDEIVYGKGSDDHKATVVGDTVGDPFKDTSGPSLNILIKLISIVSVVFAGLTVAYGPVVGALLGLN